MPRAAAAAETPNAVVGRFLSAQRVSNKQKGGINCSLYLHDGDPPRKPTGEIDEAAVFAERGRLIAYEHELKPGGNRISSYVDIALARASHEDVSEIVAVTLQRLKRDVPPIQLTSRAAAIELNMDFGLYPRAASELQELVARALVLLPRVQNAPAWHGRDPLRIRVVHDGNATRFALEPASATRIRTIHPNWGRAISITIDDETGADFEAMHGSVLPHVAQMMLKLDTDDIRELGGIQFLDAATGDAIGRWPPTDED
jgi:hypothetical protein